MKAGMEDLQPPGAKKSRVEEEGGGEEEGGPAPSSWLPSRAGPGEGQQVKTEPTALVY